MLRAAILVFLFAVACAESANKVAESTAVDVITLDEIDEYVAKHPEIELEKEQTQSGFQFIFTFGNRIRGDRVVDDRRQSFNAFHPQSWNTNYTYPISGTGANVTFARIVLNVSSNYGRAFIIGGGIGQRQIIVRIEARNSLFFTWTAEVFGSSGCSCWNNYCSILLLPIIIISAYFVY